LDFEGLVSTFGQDQCLGNISFYEES